MNLSEYRKVPEYPKYLVSPYGDIWSTVTNKLFTKRVNSRGYYQTCFSVNGVEKRHLLHRVVASAFLGIPLNDYSVEVDHINNDKSINHYSNLQPLESENHRIKTIKHRGQQIKTKNCEECGKRFEDRTENRDRKICYGCIKHKYDVISESDIIKSMKETGSWVKSAKEFGLSDNGLRKVYKKVSGKDPKELKNKLKD